MPDPEASKPRGSWMAIILVLLVAICAVVGLMFLTLGYFVLVLIIGAGVFGFAAFHYLVWGWWLTKVIREEEERKGAEEE